MEPETHGPGEWKAPSGIQPDRTVLISLYRFSCRSNRPRHRGWLSALHAEEDIDEFGSPGENPPLEATTISAPTSPAENSKSHRAISEFGDVHQDCDFLWKRNRDGEGFELRGIGARQAQQSSAVSRGTARIGTESGPKLESR
jgi:hypothetical protein